MKQFKKPSSIIITNNLSFEIRNGILVIKNLSLSLNDEKSGLIGKNGSGKTTLLQLLVGELEPTHGKIKILGNLAYLRQDYQLDLEQTIAKALGVDAILEALQQVRAGVKNQEFIKIVGSEWDIEDRISQIFEQLKIVHLTLDRLLNSLSGGERAKVIIAKLLIFKPDYLILDEPTNHLDLNSRKTIYELIKHWPHGLLVVSHDRSLLNLLDQILELADGQLKVYGGNYDAYLDQKRLEDQAAERQLISAEQTLKQTKRQAQKTKEKQQKKSARGKNMRDKVGLPKVLLGKMKETSENTTAHMHRLQEQRIEGAIKNLEAAKSKISPSNEIYIELPKTNLSSGKLVVSLNDVSFSYRQKTIFNHFTIELHGPVRLALTGPNGAGKTTLIKLMLQQLLPNSGKITLGVDRFAYLDQEMAMLQSDKTLMENLQRMTSLDATKARKWLALFLFRGEDVFKRVAMLSGGERMRAALACILGGENPPQLLVLDEPTNNLDLSSIQQMESALLNYKGALIVISHDPSFLRAIGINDTLLLPLKQHSTFGADGRN